MTDAPGMNGNGSSTFEVRQNDGAAMAKLPVGKPAFAQQASRPAAGIAPRTAPRDSQELRRGGRSMRLVGEDGSETTSLAWTYSGRSPLVVPIPDRQAF